MHTYTCAIYDASATAPALFPTVGGGGTIGLPDKGVLVQLGWFNNLVTLVLLLKRPIRSQTTVFSW
jgi:hypothetical protein